jgi:serine/threonine protein kinase/tetratricopeptide (TPR) repeat protein
MFRAGQQFGNYTLINRIGRGGFGEVWLSERRAKFVTTKVAVKLPLAEQVDYDAIRQEATLWEQASGHPNILPIIDADEIDGQVLIVSEYAPEGSLEEWLKQNGRMSVDKAAASTVQILDGLEFLHLRKIVHRDLKPANILLQSKTLRLADFGISRALRTTSSSQSQNISGTFAYMAPEALNGTRSVQTDIWSVGVNLYQFLTGTLPFPQKDPSILFPAIIMGESEPLPAWVPPEMKRIVSTAMARLPEHRYKNCDEMRKDLQLFLQTYSSQPDLDSTEVDAEKPDDEETVFQPKPVTPYPIHQPSAGRKWIYVLVSAVVLLLVVGGVGIAFLSSKIFAPRAPRPVLEVPYSEEFLQGKACAEQKNFECAIENYSKAIKANPANAEAYNGRGWAYLEKDKFDQAVDDCSKAITLKPDYSEAYTCRGRARGAQDDYNASFSDCDKAIELKADSAEAYACRGSAEFWQDRYVQSFNDCDKAIKLKPDFGRAYACRGLVYDYKDHELDKAMADYNTALGLDPDNANIYVNRGIAYFKQKQYEKALQDWNKVIAQKPNLDSAYYNRALYFSENKHEYRKALNDCDKAVNLNPIARNYICRGNAYFSLRNYTQAEVDYGMAIQLKPTASVYLARGNAYSNDEKFTQAISDYDQAISLESDLAEAFKGRGYAYSRERRYDEAIKDYNRAIELDSNDAWTYNSRGVAFANKGDWAQAIADYERALKIDPNIENARNNLDIAISKREQEGP